MSEPAGLSEVEMLARMGENLLRRLERAHREGLLRPITYLKARASVGEAVQALRKKPAAEPEPPAATPGESIVIQGADSSASSTAPPHVAFWP